MIAFDTVLRQAMGYLRDMPKNDGTKFLAACKALAGTIRMVHEADDSAYTAEYHEAVDLFCNDLKLGDLYGAEARCQKLLEFSDSE